LTLSGSATGQTIAGGISGSSSSTLTLSGSATGQVSLVGTSTGTLTLSGTGTGQISIVGTSTGTLILSGTATGQTIAGGIAGSSSANFVLSGSAAGGIAVSGQSSSSLTLSGSATGNVSLQGNSNKILDFTGTSSGSTFDNVPLTGGSIGLFMLSGFSYGVQLNDVVVEPKKKSHQDLIAKGMGWFEKQRNKYMVRDIVYTRKGVEYEMTATTARTTFESIGPTGFPEKMIVMDFIIAKNLMTDIFPPKKGDTVSYNGNTYEVMSLPGIPEFEYTDADRRAVRVHTKQVGASVR
jgi:hypothetical protein